MYTTLIVGSQNREDDIFDQMNASFIDVRVP